MGKLFESLAPSHIEFIQAQKIFFVATAAPTGSVNLSPKGMDTFRCISPNEVAYLDLTGSGNETAAHLKLSDRITFMFCSFGEKPMIMRLRGAAKAIHSGEPDWESSVAKFPLLPGTRQIIISKIDSVQTSCGFAVPLMDFKSERSMLSDWSSKKGEEGIHEYWGQKNTESIDGFDTGMTSRLSGEDI